MDLTDSAEAGRVLSFLQKRDVLESSYGESFKKRLNLFKDNIHSDTSCLICGKTAKNGYICEQCLELIYSSKEKSKKASKGNTNVLPSKNIRNDLKYCIYCGEQLKNVGDHFCWNCGKDVTTKQSLNEVKVIPDKTEPTRYYDEKGVFFKHCPLCGKRIMRKISGYSLITDSNGNLHETCYNCYKKAKDQGKSLKYDDAKKRVILVDPEFSEIRKKCNVCGSIFCFTTEDVLENNRKYQSNKKQAVNNVMLSGLRYVNGDKTNANLHMIQADAQISNMNNVRNFRKCPNCGSESITLISEDDFKGTISDNPIKTDNTFSAADEIKKYKELVDIGAITMEEFEKKKNQLLHLNM